MAYAWDFAPVFQHAPDLLLGALNTLKLVASSLCIALPVGTLLGVVRQRRIPVLAALATAYIEFFRTSVALVLICWCYYALPVLLNINFSTFLAVTIALGVQSSAFMAEIVRGGIESISHRQWEASRALGMQQRASLHYVIMPQALRRMLPVIFLLVVELVKNTALAGVVTYNELFYEAYNVSSITFRPLETFTVVAIVYFLVIWSGSMMARSVERKLARADR